MIPDNQENQVRVGIPYAFDASGRKVYAYNAIRHQKYECPFCHCLLFPKCNHKGTHFFARFVGEIHRAEQCRQIEKTGKYHTFLETEDPQTLSTRLCQVSAQRQKSGKNMNHPQKHESSEPVANDDLVATRFMNLSQIFTMGLIDKNPHEQIGNYELCDYYIHYNWAKEVIGYKHTDLQGRILQSAIILCNDYEKIFLFGMYSPSYSVRFALKATTASVYNAIQNKLYEKKLIPESNKLRPVKKTNQVLIVATDWIYIPVHQCQGYYCRAEKKYCSNCAGLYLATAVTPKQVFPIPTANHQ